MNVESTGRTKVSVKRTKLHLRPKGAHSRQNARASGEWTFAPFPLTWECVLTNKGVMRLGPFEIRNAVTDDADALATLHVAAWRHAYAGIMPEAYLARLDAAERVPSWRGRIGNPAPRTGLFVLTQDGKPAGFGMCGPARLPELGTDGEIFAINILPGPPQQCRAGSALMALMADSLAANAFNRVGLWVLERNHRGMGFYQRLGGTAGTARPEDFDGTELIERAQLWPSPAALAESAHRFAREAGWR